MSPRTGILAEVERKVQAAEDAMQAALAQIAEDVRARVVLPVCAEHGLRFVSGNGTYFFRLHRDGEPSRWSDAMEPEAPASVRVALSVLDVPIGSHQLGFYVRSADPIEARQVRP